MPDNNLEILIVQAMLDKTVSTKNIKDQLLLIAKELEPLKINITIDPDTIKTLQNFTTTFNQATQKVNDSLSNQVKIVNQETQAINQATEAQKKYNVEKQKTITAADNSYKTTSNTSGTKFDNTTTSQTLHSNGDIVDHPTIQNVDYAGLERVSQKANETHLAEVRKNLLQEENEWNNFVTKQEQNYQKYLTTTGKNLLKEESDLSDFVNKVEQSYKKLNDATNKGLLQEENDWNSFVSKQEQGYQKYLTSIEKATNAKRQSLIDIQKLEQQYGNSVNNTKLSSIKQNIEQIDPLKPDALAKIKEGNFQIKEVSSSIDKARSSSVNFGEQLKSAFARLPSFLLIGAEIGAVTGFLKEGIQYVNEYNKALTLIATTTNKSSTEINQLGKDFQQMAQQMGVSTKEIADGSIEFFRNKSMSNDEVKKNMQTVVEYSKISGTEIDASSKIVISAMNTMKTTALNASDVFTLLGDSVSSSANTIGTAFQYVGGEAESINIPFQKTAAYIAVISSVTKRSAEEIGTAIKSIYARAESLKTTGFNADGQDKTQVAKALDSIGVKLFDTQGQFRNFGTVLDETGAKWASLDTRHRQYISTVLGG